MIKNERQYWATRSEVERFERLLTESEENEANDEVHPLIAKARRDASNSRLLDLKADLQEYESLKAGKFNMSDLMIVSALPEMLIKARIARGMTQRDLAERIDLKEQQIQRYEATDYASASLSRIMDVVAGLRAGNVTSTPPDEETDKLFRSLTAAFEAPSSKKMDFRFEVRPKASIYIRKHERNRDEHIARINRRYIRHFPNPEELQHYLDKNGIELDRTTRDYLIGPEHIDSVIAILKR